MSNPRHKQNFENGEELDEEEIDLGEQMQQGGEEMEGGEMEGMEGMEGM